MEFTKCCGCVNLKTGCLIIGYLHLVFGFCEFVTFATYFGMSISHLYSPEWLQVIPVYLIGVHAVLTFISIGFTIGLIYGLHKNVHRYIHPYLVYNAIFLIFHVFDFFFFFMFRANFNDLVLDFLSIFLTAYFLLVIKSYWTQLKDQRRIQNSAQTSPPAYSAAVTYPTVASYPAAPAIYSESTEKPPLN